ncbi:hypothetical protein PAHAL_1G297700 [Panicum hallii]|jgi:hypothetical protein|uniref:Uncharacterized protein n=1 Tax=Panicum hallii TaxID=206008 RepID=A0A2T8KWV7_9POAL|nr:hypothetical protein PAHAL_1G297700 [Panicum hallii]
MGSLEDQSRSESLAAGGRNKFGFSTMCNRSPVVFYAVVRPKHSRVQSTGQLQVEALSRSALASGRFSMCRTPCNRCV